MRELLLTKALDRSLLGWGTAIPRSRIQHLDQLLGLHIERGASLAVKVLVQGEVFDALIRNLNRNVPGDTYQLRYEGNQALKAAVARLDPECAQAINDEFARLKRAGAKKPRIEIASAPRVDLVLVDGRTIELAIVAESADVPEALVLVENEATAQGEYDFWADDTGLMYHYPNSYRRKVRTGLPFVYYRGVRRANGKRGPAEYFGWGIIGRVWQDPDQPPDTAARDRRWYCAIEQYKPFANPVPAKQGDRTYETISNALGWRNGVRVISYIALERIVMDAGGALIEAHAAEGFESHPDAVMEEAPRRSVQGAGSTAVRAGVDQMLNPCVREILKFSYEFERSIARPNEPADWFAQRIYVDTLLDEQLLPDIVHDKFDLVLITGNPGDGKSAFMRHLMAGNGLMTEQGRKVRVLHDATEPKNVDDRSASALNDLVAFLEPLTDDGWNPEFAHSEMFVVGINKGLLVRAFLSDTGAFSRLRSALTPTGQPGTRLAEGVRVRVVDLNDRSEMQFGADAEDLFGKIVGRLVCEENWEASGCGECDSQSWCPFFANARLMRSLEKRNRLRLLWLVQQLDGERHSTLRDLLAGLAYLLVGHEDMYHEQDNASLPLVDPCEFVASEKTVGSFAPLLSRLIYNSCFTDDQLMSDSTRQALGYGASSPAITWGMAPAVVRDQINGLDPVRGLSSYEWDEVENGVVKSPRRYLKKMRKEAESLGVGLEIALADACEGAFERLDEELDEFDPGHKDYALALESYDYMVQFLVELAKRRHYFFAGGVKPELMTSYAGLNLFLSALMFDEQAHPEHVDAHDTVLHEVMPKALQNAERVGMPSNPDEFRLRWSRNPSITGAVLVMNSNGPNLSSGPSRDPYVEFFPQYLSYDPGFAGGSSPLLRLSLRAFEGIYQISKGYSDRFAGVPRTNQFSNFRDSIRGHAASRLILLDETEPDSTVSVTVSAGRMRFD